MATAPLRPAPALPTVLRSAFCASALAAALLPTTAAAQAPERLRDGLYIHVPNPITDVACSQIEAQIKHALERKARSLRAIVFDFNPDGRPAGTSKFGPCYELAQIIRRTQQNNAKVATVAYVHNLTTNHTVLPAVACKELVTSSKGQLGDVLRDQAGGLSETEKQAYSEVAALKPSPSLVWKMVFADLTIKEAQTDKGAVVYVDDDPARLAAAKKAYPGLKITKVAPGLEAGAVNTLFDSKKARQFGLAKAVYETQADLLAGYQLPAHVGRRDSLIGRTPVPWRVDLTGTVNKAKLDSLERRVRNAVGRGANIIILYLDCEGGETTDVASTAQVLRNLKGDSGVLYVKTVAYVPPRRSLGAATFLALGCSEIVMASDAHLGDFSYLKDQKQIVETSRTMLVNLAGEQGYPKALFRATLDADVVVVKAHPKDLPDDERLLVSTEVPEGWVTKARIPVAPGEFLKINAALAHEWGVAKYVNVNDAESLYRQYELDAARVRVSRDDWLDKVAEFFREDMVKVFLIVLGIAGLILELKMPGLGVPGIVAALCFVLFFWAHSFVGQFTMLAVFLFLLGLVLIGIEIFVLPGFGVTGISGIALIVTSLVLVTLERMPETSQDWFNLGATVTTFGVSLVAAILGAVLLAWYLPHIPYASRMVLQPPVDTAEDGTDRNGGAGPYAALLGAIGVAATTLRPAGKARFGEEYLDVIAEGTYVNPGSRVQVIEIEGNRIVVKEV